MSPILSCATIRPAARSCTKLGPQAMPMPSWIWMAVLLSGSGLRKAFGARVLFDNLSLSLSEGDRTGLIGPNGSGKTTLLEILAGKEPPDAGVRALRKQTTLAYVPQDSVFGPDDTVGSVLRAALD